ncbi:MAG: M1 family metallopeptidase [Robiginitomaculum sp.]|nr:M1 family metallopeptidase [Robiginitomaculum sp.]
MGTTFKAIRYGAYSTIAATLVLSMGSQAFADGPAGSKHDSAAKFRQLGQELPTPNVYRNASGAPGVAYWQQQADYNIDVAIDEDKRQLIASSDITYHNNSPDTLKYLWVQLDQNRFKDGSIARMSETAANSGSRRDKAGAGDSLSYNAMRRIQALEDTEYGFVIKDVSGADGKPLPYIINDTMMRIDLPVPLAPGEQVEFSIDWQQNILDEAAVGGRGGYEYFPKTDTYLYFLAQWFPRMATYSDYDGWHNKQFLGRGEFTLEFGDYEVNITVPSDHIVTATGVLQNPTKVLTKTQRKRLDQASATKQVFIVTPEEALENEKSRAKGTKTWRFKAENVRDFSFASSRKFIWDAKLHEQDSETMPVVTAMSFYPNEAEPIWSKYSTASVIHTMDVYNRFTFAYPYPVSISVNTWERGGMEYPMITFNGYRPTKDEKTGEITYSRNIKHAMIGVIIHEVGHNYFPMIVNSDEREWTWMDEGLNTFLEYLTEYEWDKNFNILGGQTNPLDVIPNYMKSSGQVPIMTQSDSILQFGPNAYSKPASSLIVLRETVMGRELFDHAFKEYAQRWKFKRPTPSDFFRTMEDASGVDLDWFWRGWYFGTDYVDVGITGVREYTIADQDPDVESKKERKDYWRDNPKPISEIRNEAEGIVPYVERNKDLKDLYYEKDKFTVTNKDRNSHKKFLKGLKDWEREVYERAVKDGQYIYFVDFENVGGLVTPLPLTIHYRNGETEEMMIPAEIWRRNSENITKLLVRSKRIESIDLDNAHQTADADFANNSFPAKITQSRLEIFKGKRKGRSLMADMLVELDGESTDKPSNVGEKDMPLNAKDTPDTDKKPDDIDNLTDEEKGLLKRLMKRLSK